MTNSASPAGVLDRAIDMDVLVHAASLAPSSHNTQPWRFRIDGPVVDVMADRTRALPVNDPHDRELIISCGCALFNLRVAAAAASLDAVVDVFPNAADHDHLARVRLATTAVRPADAELHEALIARRTYRRRFASTVVAPETIRRLAEAVAREGAVFTWLETDDQRRRAGALVEEGDAALWASASWRSELAAWMHPRRRGDGLSMPALAVPVAQLVVRRVDMGHGVAARDRQLSDESPLLAVLSTPGDQPGDWLAAGQALQRCLLVGVRNGLQASYLNQPIQVAALRPAVQQLTGRPGFAQLLIRMGAPSETLPAAPRRPITDIIARP